MTKPVTKDLNYSLTIAEAQDVIESLAALRQTKLRSLNAIAYRKAYGHPIPQRLLDDEATALRADRVRRGLILSLNKHKRAAK